MSRYQIIKKITSLISIQTFKSILKFLKHYVGGTWKRMDEHNLFLAASGIAFSLVVSMIPFIMVVFSVIGNLVPIELIEKQIFQLIETVIPYGQYADYTKELIMNRVPGAIQYTDWVGYFGVLGLIFTASWLFSSMRTILNSIFGVSRERSAIYGFLRDMGMVVIFLFFITLSTFILPLLNIMINSAVENEFLAQFRINDVLSIVFYISSVLVIFLLFFTIYYLIPYAKLGKKVPAVAAFWATLLWEIMRNAFGYYVNNFMEKSSLYGAFLLLIVIAFWLFYSCVLFVLGAEIGQLYRERLIVKEKNKTDIIKKEL